MEEFKNVRQDQSGFKRMFHDDTFDLFVWYDHEGGNIVGFQLVYGKDDLPRALTWLKDKGFRHNEVDGYDSHNFNETPILVADGTFKTQAVNDLFLAHSDGIDEAISTFVYSTIRKYDPRLDDQSI